jgi:hypothetical protein
MHSLPDGGSSLPGLTRQSIFFAKWMDPRVKPAGDARGKRKHNNLKMREIRHAPLRSTMQAPPARRMLPHRPSAACRVSAPTRTW